jgi:tight adherence protein C
LLIGFASILIFGAVALFIIGLGRQRQTDPLSTRLQAMGAETSLDAMPWWLARRSQRGFITRFLTRIAGFLPSSSGEDSIRDGLIEAGYRSPGAVAVFLGSKLSLAVLLPVIAAIVMTALGRNPFGGTRLMLLVASGVLGFYLPTLWLWSAGNKRKLEIQHALPDSLDLMVVCVEAGLGMAAAIQRVGQEMALASRALSDELLLVNQEMQTGVSRTDALRNLAERTGVEDIYSLVAMLIQTDKLGTSVAQSLRSHAESMRTKRRQRAEQLARKASIKLAFPLVFLIFPALLVVILGPAGIQLMKALGAE